LGKGRGCECRRDLSDAICARLCPLGPLDRAVELRQLGSLESLPALHRVGVDPEAEGRIRVPELLGRVGGVVAGRGAEARVGAPETVEADVVADRLDAEPDEPLVRPSDRGEQQAPADVLAVVLAALQRREDEVGRALNGKRSSQTARLQKLEPLVDAEARLVTDDLVRGGR
jgi:hypothetical protein